MSTRSDARLTSPVPFRFGPSPEPNGTGSDFVGTRLLEACASRLGVASCGGFIFSRVRLRRSPCLVHRCGYRRTNTAPSRRLMEHPMLSDIVYIALTASLFALSWGF